MAGANRIGVAYGRDVTVVVRVDPKATFDASIRETNVVALHGPVIGNEVMVDSEVNIVQTGPEVRVHPSMQPTEGRTDVDDLVLPLVGTSVSHLLPANERRPLLLERRPRRLAAGLRLGEGGVHSEALRSQRLQLVALLLRLRLEARAHLGPLLRPLLVKLRLLRTRWEPL